MILRLPYNYTASFIDNEKTIYNYKDSIFFNPIVYNRYKANEDGGSRIYHKVRKGQTLSSIAKRYGVTVSQIKDWNNMSAKTKTVKTGRTLIIYKSAAASASQSSSKSSSGTKTAASSGKSSGGTRTYTVKKGDTLYGIAKKNNMSLNELLKMNGLTAKSTIHAGKKLKVK